MPGLGAPDQLPLQVFLKDPVFRKYFTKQPKLRASQRSGHKPWRLYVQKVEDGSWQRGDVYTYKAAYQHARQLITDGVHDIAIQSKAVPYYPPLVKGEPWTNYPSSHEWCPYCRRPTVFWWFVKHHALRQFGVLNDEPRCSICANRKYDTYTIKYQAKEVSL